LFASIHFRRDPARCRFSRIVARPEVITDTHKDRLNADLLAFLEA
jgi:hypothetical protein